MSATEVSNPGDVLADLAALEGHEAEKEAARERREETRRRLERAQSRGLGRMHLTVNYPREGKDAETVAFARLPIAEANAILEEVEELDQQGRIGALGHLITESLGEWCLDADKDQGHWERELTIGDGVGLLQKVALGGNREVG